jgi:hypothetical protein
MTQPSFVPIAEADQVRPSYRLRTPGDWRQDRPSELLAPMRPRGRELGSPGPDQGYALLLFQKLFASRVEVPEGESSEDVMTASATVASARAALFGRAPIGQDLELALVVLGYMGDAPASLVAWRQRLVRGAAHDYRVQRRVADVIEDDTLRMTPAEARARLDQWQSLVRARD